MDTVTQAGIASIRRPSRKILASGHVWAIGFVALVVILALSANWIGLENYRSPIGRPRTPPFQEPNLLTLLGTDNFGRSVLARLVHGSRVSLAVSLSATVLGVTLGAMLGLLAARIGRWLKQVIDILADSMLAIPPILFMLVVVTMLKPSFSSLVLGLAFWVTPASARLVYANAVGASKQNYVIAAEALGASDFSIMMREILPNILGSIAAFSVVLVANLIVAEGALSFLGLGIPAPQPSWGGMIAAGKSEMSRAPYLLVFPILAIFMSVVSLRTLGKWIESQIASTRSEGAA